MSSSAILLAALALLAVAGTARPDSGAAPEWRAELPQLPGAWADLFRREDHNPRRIADFLAEVRAKPGLPRTVLLETTLSWGCACPTWVFPFHRDMQDLRYVMVLPGAALRHDPTDFAMPGLSYRMTGHFTGAIRTGLEWAGERKAPPPNFPRASARQAAVREYWSEPGLVFVVDDWCFEADGDQRDARRLRKRGAPECSR
jgi:hypothetical protein